jgi:hypothetical protein
MMHAFALLMGSILCHSWAKALVSKAQRVAIYFHSHSKAKAIFKEQKAAMRIPGGFPSKANKTRFTSVYDCVESVERHAPVFTALAYDERLNEDIQAILQEPSFFRELGILVKLVLPIAQVVMAVQSVHATLADITRYWLYLARAIGDVLNDTVARRLLPSGNYIPY